MCHLGGCAGQPPIHMFCSHRRLKEECCGRIRWRAFPLRQPHNGLPVCGKVSQHSQWLDEGNFLCTCSPSQWHQVTAGWELTITLNPVTSTFKESGWINSEMRQCSLIHVCASKCLTTYSPSDDASLPLLLHSSLRLLFDTLHNFTGSDWRVRLPQRP